MIKIVNEYVVRTEEQKDIILDRLYNDPSLRRYGDFLDIFFYRAEQTIENCYPVSDTNLTNWINVLKRQCKFYSVREWINWKWPYFGYPLKSDQICRDAVSECELAESLGVDIEKNDYLSEVENKLQNVLRKINLILKNDETLKNDLFYSSSGTEADINDNDWEEIKQIVQRIAEYTENYNFEFTPSEVELIKKHMKKTSQTLYRIEGYDVGFPFRDYELGAKKTICWDGRYKALKSFTEDLDCRAMIGMKNSRSIYGRGIVIYVTQGDVYSFNIDQVSNYAEDIDTVEYEHFVSGEFEIVDTKRERTNIDDRDIDLIYVYIKQIHK